MENQSIEEQAMVNVQRRLKTFRLMMDLGETRTQEEVMHDMITAEAARIRQQQGALALRSSTQI